MRIVIHTGAGDSYGLGHATRMRALATALTAEGASVAFLTPTPALVDVVAPFPCTLSPHAWPSCSTVCDVLVEDVPPSAAASPWWYARLREHMRVVRVDVPTATHATCDLLIGPCAHWDPATVTQLHVAFGSRFLYGWDYVLLEEAVTQLPRSSEAASEYGSVVFCAGGSDPHGMLAQMLSWAGPPPAGAAWLALVPEYGTFPPALPHGVHALPFRRKRVRRAALLVTSFGVTCYEALYWGVPAFMLAVQDATREDAVRLMRASRDAVRAVGIPEPGFPDSLRILITSLLEQRGEQQRMRAASLGLLDGLGAQRAATAILSLERVSS